jgi:hypothetical protein
MPADPGHSAEMPIEALLGPPRRRPYRCEECGVALSFDELVAREVDDPVLEMRQLRLFCQPCAPVDT